MFVTSGLHTEEWSLIIGWNNTKRVFVAPSLASNSNQSKKKRIVSRPPSRATELTFHYDFINFFLKQGQAACTILIKQMSVPDKDRLRA